MEERIEVAFASNENDFIHNFGVNKGFSMSYSKVNRCYFLSSNAKQLYHNICDYAYGGRRDCFPSQNTLRAELGWSKQTIVTYTKELVDLGFISTKRRQGKSMLYHIHELHRIPALVHSEIVHEIRVSLAGDRDDFFQALEDYKESELCQEIMKCPNPLERKHEIIQWFSNYFASGTEEAQTEAVSPEPTPPVVNLPRTFSVEGVRKEANPDRTDQRRARKELDPYKLPPDEWNANHFARYFEEEYQRKFKIPYAVSAAERGQLKRLIEKLGDKKAILKTHMDNFLALDFFEEKRLLVFTSQWAQVILDAYLDSGKLPSYKAGKSTSSAKYDASEEWKREADALFK